MDGWAPLFQTIRAGSRILARGEALFHAGDPADAIFHVEHGRLRLLRHDADGGVVVLHTAEAGSLFAEAALFSPRYHCDARAECDSRVRVYPKAAVLLHLSAHPDLNLAFSAYLARQLQTLRGRVELIRIKNARQRVVAWLTQLGAAEREITVERPLTAIAAEIGLTHEALYRALARLVADGRLRRAGKRSFRLVGP